MSTSAVFIDKVQALRPEYAGSNEKEKNTIKSLISESPKLASDLKTLNDKLVPLTYLHALQPTVADVALYTELHGQVSKLDSAAYYQLPAVTRYFNHIQHLQPVVEARTLLRDSPYLLVEFDLDSMPPLERKVETKEKKPKAAAAAAPAKKEEKVTEAKPEKKEVRKETESTGAETAQDKPKKEKKEKKEKAASSEPKKPKQAAAEPQAPQPSMIDLRVGKVLEVSRHPDADSLYVETIDLGEETGPRIVCSGLVKYMKEEEILGQSLVVVCNLKPATMRGVKSFAMLLCATSSAGKDEGIEFVKPPPGSQPGERIYFEGAKFENQTPETQLNPKKKTFETIQPDFTTLDTLEACWIDPVTKEAHKIRTKDGVCKVGTFVGASLS